MTFWRKLHFRTQIFLAYLLTSLLLVGIMVSAIFYSTSGIIRQEAANTTAMAIEKSGRQLEMYISELKGFSTILAENPQVCRYFGSASKITAAAVSDKADVESLVSAMMRINPEIASIILIGLDGQLISNEKNLDMHFTGSVKDQDWYKAILAAEMPVLTSARMQEFSMDQDTWVISLGRELLGQNNETIGVLRMDLHYDTIVKILQELNLGKNGYAYILNSTGQVVYHPDAATFTDPTLQKKMQDMLTMPDKALSHDYQLLHKSDIAGTDWRLVGVASLDGVIRMQGDIILTLWLLGTFLLVLVLAGSNLFAGNLTRPLKKLEEAMLRAEEGFLQTTLPDGGNVEIESLSKHFRDMMVQMKQLMADNAQKEKSLRQSEMKSLYSQINPHFLYNTLDTIIWQAELGEMDRVVTLSQAMAKFFRLSLHGGSEMTTVRDELDHVRQYLMIQRERYGDQLQYTIDADESILDETMPKILLQPLVENAIYHGLRSKTGDWQIRIAAKDEGTNFTLSVSDNGAGFDIAVPVKRSEKMRLGGVGLNNIDERLQLYFGGKSNMHIRSEAGKGTDIVLTLPKAAMLG